MMTSLSAHLRWIALAASLLVPVSVAGCGGDEAPVNDLRGFTIVTPRGVLAGESVRVLVLARGSLFSPSSSYRGTVQFDSDDAKAEFVPSSYSFTALDAGAHEFSVVFKTAGQHSLHVVDTAASAEGSEALRVAAAAAAQLAVVSGDGQRGGGGKALADPFVAKVTDAYGNAVNGKAVTWAVTSGSGAVTPAAGATAADGTASATATLGAGQPANAYTASADGVPSVTFSATRNPYRLQYTDPTTGVVRLVRNTALNDGAVVLDFVASQAPAAAVYTAGFNLPLDATKVALDASKSFVLPTSLALDPGSAPRAAMAALPSSGPLAGNLVTVLSQKATGAGAVLTDTSITAGAVLYSIVLTLRPDGAPGLVFDGIRAPAISSGGLLNKAGEAVVLLKDVGIGKLEVVE